MSKHARDRRPYIPPVKRIELSESNTTARWIAIVVLLAVAVTAMAVGLSSALTTDPGWRQVEVPPTNTNCSGDFVFVYEFGAGDVKATGEYKNVVNLYTSLTERGYQLFSAQEGSLGKLNSNPNTVVTLPQELYEALELLTQSGIRYPFFAPAAREYSGVFLADNDADAALFDPNRDPERMAFVQEAVAYCADPAHISLELLDQNQVKLVVSEAYLAYGRENEIDVYFDFGWMKNAFLVDFLAEELAQAGYTRGHLTSFDGFTRNLDSRGGGYSYNLFDRLDNSIFIPARLNYTGPMSIVALRNYPLSDADRWHYHVYGDGAITSVYLDLRGQNTSSTDNLTCYSQTDSCAEILMQAAPLFLAEELDYVGLGAMEAAGIHSVWAEGHVLIHTQNDADMQLLTESGDPEYMLVALK